MLFRRWCTFFAFHSPRSLPAMLSLAGDVDELDFRLPGVGLLYILDVLQVEGGR